jgi:hypothetical protein
MINAIRRIARYIGLIADAAPEILQALERLRMEVRALIAEIQRLRDEVPPPPVEDDTE